jgi:DNA polymerase-3 subunit gamma/tau
MSYVVLARKWRPQAFDELIGQQHAVQTLSNALSKDKVHHAWLFTGTRGVGKTTLARIFTKALNCEKGESANPCNQCSTCQSITKGNFIDFIEVDAASRTGVDNVRELLENINYAPVSGRYRVYLIDEIHMFSTASFNALLKTLEEPPAHVKFLMATTDPQKLPITILSRCLQLKLTRVESNDIEAHLQRILSEEKIQFEQDALPFLANAADGSVRDSLSLLDQAIAMGNGEVKTEVVKQMIGLSEESRLYDALMALAKYDGEGLLEETREMLKSNTNYSGLLNIWLEYFHQLALYLQLGKQSLLASRIKDVTRIQEVAKYFSIEEIHLLYHLVFNSQEEIKKASNPAHSFEMLVLRLIAFRPKKEEEKTKIPENLAESDVVSSPTNENNEEAKKKN